MTGGSMADGGSSAGGAAPEADANPTWGCARGLASGARHTCVLYDDGRASCLGWNAAGQLGTGDTTSAATFVSVLLDGIDALAAGGDHTCASVGAEIHCWGANRAGQLGAEALEASSTPVSTASAEFGVVQLALGDEDGCYIDGSGHGYCWGTGPDGLVIASPQPLGSIGLKRYEFVQLGGAVARLVSEERLYDLPWEPLSAVAYRATPGAPAGVVQNAIGSDHDCVLKRSGSVWCRGEGYEPFYAVVADFGSDVVQVEVSDGFDCAVTRQGTVLCRGRNESAQLGNGTVSFTAQATMVGTLENAVEVSLAGSHACARLSDGSVSCWGTPPGGRIFTTPERFAGPTSDQSCEGVRATPRPWDLPFPESTGADELSDALTAWGQNMCRCAFTELVGIQSCVDEEVRVLGGCLEALARDGDDAALCEAELAWGAAQCATTCIGESRPSEDCNMALSGNTCGAHGGVFDFCKQNSLGCDGPLSEIRVWQSKVCDGITDCENGFDEANCTRGSEAFTCADGSTVALELVADASEDCPDGSDEWLR